MQTPAIIHLDVDAFFASVEQRDDPALRGRPVAVGTGVVASCSYEAKRRGVRTAMSLLHARRVCPELRVVPGDYRRYESAGKRILGICHEKVVRVEVAALDDLYLAPPRTHALADAARLAEQWDFEVPARPGINAPEMIDAAHRGELTTLFSVGGNFLEVLPDPAFVEEALARVPLRVHYDIVLSSQMLVDPADSVLLLPAATRYETPGGVTETTTERRVVLSPEIPGRRIGEARPEWEVLLDLARQYGAGASGNSRYPVPVGNRSNLQAQLDEKQQDESLQPGTLDGWTILHQKIGELPPAEREVAMLLFYDGLDQEEIASVMEVSVRTVKRLWQSAKIILRATMDHPDAT